MSTMICARTRFISTDFKRIFRFENFFGMLAEKLHGNFLWNRVLFRHVLGRMYPTEFYNSKKFCVLAWTSNGRNKSACKITRRHTSVKYMIPTTTAVTSRLDGKSPGYPRTCVMPTVFPYYYVSEYTYFLNNFILVAVTVWVEWEKKLPHLYESSIRIITVY